MKKFSPTLSIIVLCFVSILVGITEHQLGKLYTKNYYCLGDDERQSLLKQGSTCTADLTYGEITFKGAKKLLDYLNLTNDDVFYDLGSGLGKLVIQAYFNTPIKKSVGVELAPSRFNEAEKALNMIKTEHKLIPNKNIQFINGDILTTNFDDATVIYISSTCFSDHMMNQLVKKFAQLNQGTRIASLRRLPSNSALQHIETLIIPMSWSETTEVNFYRII